MKTTVKIIFSVIILSVSFFGYSQINPSGKRTTGWVISKDVQKFSNKNWASNNRGLTIKSLGYPNVAISKQVQVARKSASGSLSSDRGNIVSTGYPVWTMSKEVNKIARRHN